MSTNGENAPRGTGMTGGDVLDSILRNPKRWFALMGLLAGMAGLVILVMLVFTRLFGVQTKEFRLGGSDTHILFSAVDKGTGKEEYLVIVSPQSWQRTDIEVRAGDHLSFNADGKVCIDLYSIWENVNLRQQYERELEKGKNGIHSNDANEKRVPEDFFNPAQRKSLILDRPWVDPDGFDLQHFLPSFRSRSARYLLPSANAAGLIAAIKGGTDASPARSDAFFVGRSKDCTVGDSKDCRTSQTGWLWFTVNDVQYNDPNNPNLFYNDNLGVFWVRVVVKRG